MTDWLIRTIVYLAALVAGVAVLCLISPDVRAGLFLLWIFLSWLWPLVLVAALLLALPLLFGPKEPN